MLSALGPFRHFTDKELPFVVAHIAAWNVARKRPTEVELRRIDAAVSCSFKTTWKAIRYGLFTVELNANGTMRRGTVKPTALALETMAKFMAEAA